ncbi:hypothetical protein FB45DRAFT_940536 [Roridomyces roridus]|uniref:WD40 repeat-like protein n=1 Tax=Roridomyces roridus TaxID=1738132 RepID=A0AAD7B6R3_9AGAR|nr:hypothetical protein FB45DRAFT_940536 [Roridomyces roridus]
MDAESPCYASLSSVFGVSGALHVSHHTNPSSQRAHAVLRRVEPCQDSSDDGQEPSIVFFKLYANKSISLKPGKELLLTIDCDDDRFKDHIVVFQGNLTTSDDESDHEGTTQVEEEEPQVIQEEEIIPEPIVPPKMRRQLWSRKLEEVSPVILKAPVAHSSIGIQVQPTPASSAVQADAPPAKIYSSTAVQTDATPLPIYTDSQNRTDLTAPPIGVKQEPHSPEPDDFSAPLFPLETPWAPEPFSWFREPSEDMVISVASGDMEMSLSPNLVKMEDLEDTMPFPAKIKEEPLEQEALPVLLSPEITSHQSLTAEALPNLPLRNPFVSGGFVTDLLGATVPDKVVKAEEYDVPIPPREEQSATASSVEVDVAASRGKAIEGNLRTTLSPSSRARFQRHHCSGGSIFRHEHRSSQRPGREPETARVTSSGTQDTCIYPLWAFVQSVEYTPLQVHACCARWHCYCRETETENQEATSGGRIEACSCCYKHGSISRVCVTLPPPSPVAANPKPVVSKWKRIDSDISLRVPASNAPSKGRIPVDKPPNDFDNNNSALHRLTWPQIKIEPQISENISQSLLEKLPAQAQKQSQSTEMGVGGLLPAAHHSLPAKPPPPSSGPPPRGIKRERANSPDLWTAPGVVRIHEQSSSSSQRRAPSPDVVRVQKQEPPPPLPATQGRKWPTVQRLHSEKLPGDGDVGIRKMAFNPGGSFIALHCWDRTLRIWNNTGRFEIARLENSSQVAAFAWLDGEDAVLTLLENGVLGKWLKRLSSNRWEWVYILDTGEKREDGNMAVCLAHSRDHIAVAFPQTGVKVWAWSKGRWVAQRSITRTHVTALKFIDGGDALIGGTRDGVVGVSWCLDIHRLIRPDSTAIDINATGTHALVTQRGGSACQVGLGSYEDNRVGKSYTNSGVRELGAVFAGSTVVFGAVHGTLLAWNADAAIIYGMEHAEGELIEAVTSCDGPHACVLTGSRQGQLCWWPQPAVQAPRKRAKVR